MPFTRITDYDGETGEIDREIYNVQIFNGKKYLVNWNRLQNYDYTTYRIVKENLEKRRAIVTVVTNSDLISKLKEDYDVSLDPKAFEENAPLYDFNFNQEELSQRR